MSKCIGEPIHGILHSTDASSGLEVPIYNDGSKTARTLADDEYIVVQSVEIVTAAGGDSYVFLGPDSSLGTGETVERGTFAANGGIAPGTDLNHSGLPGEVPYVVAPAGAVDVKVTGCIRRVMDGKRRAWKEDQA